eukprot:scpid89102/ scgid9389/ 
MHQRVREMRASAIYDLYVIHVVDASRLCIIDYHGHFLFVTLFISPTSSSECILDCAQRQSCWMPCQVTCRLTLSLGSSEAGPRDFGRLHQFMHADSALIMVMYLNQSLLACAHMLGNT